MNSTSSSAATPLSSTSSRFPRFSVNFKFRNSASTPPSTASPRQRQFNTTSNFISEKRQSSGLKLKNNPSRVDTDEYFYIPYNGPYESPATPERRRDSWGDIVY